MIDLINDFSKRWAEIDRKTTTLELSIDEKLEFWEKAKELPVGKKDAAKILGRSVRWLNDRMAEKKPPPHYKDGAGKVDFYPSELRAWKCLYLVGKIPNQA